MRILFCEAAVPRLAMLAFFSLRAARASIILLRRCRTSCSQPHKATCLLRFSDRSSSVPCTQSTHHTCPTPSGNNRGGRTSAEKMSTDPVVWRKKPLHGGWKFWRHRTAVMCAARKQRPERPQLAIEKTSASTNTLAYYGATTPVGV